MVGPNPPPQKRRADDEAHDGPQDGIGPGVDGRTDDESTNDECGSVEGWMPQSERVQFSLWGDALTRSVEAVLQALLLRHVG
jgi:hypothetical protein